MSRTQHHRQTPRTVDDGRFDTDRAGAAIGLLKKSDPIFHRTGFDLDQQCQQFRSTRTHHHEIGTDSNGNKSQYQADGTWKDIK